MGTMEVKAKTAGDDFKQYPLVMSKIAIENGPVEIVHLPIKKMVIFSIVM